MSCPAFVAQSFAVRTAAHVAHLVSESYAEHIALGEFYEGLTDLVDEYAEMFLATAPASTAFPPHIPPKTAPVKLLEDYLADVRDEQSEDTYSQAMQNTLAEIEALTLRTLYKLRRLK